MDSCVDVGIAPVVPSVVAAAVVLDAAVAAGVREVVVCPGSRSAPLALCAARDPRVRVHTRIDERSAAFFALGMARVTGRPAVVVMTSGTAVANCLPAVIEAAHAHVPLVVASADRPARLVGTGASQTIDQVGMFGGFAECVNVEPLPKRLSEDDAAEFTQAVSMLRTQVDHAFAQVGPQRPLQLNLQFDQPLVGSVDAATAWVRENLPAADDATSSPAKRHGGQWIDHGEVSVDLSKRTLVITGDEAWQVEGLEDVPTMAEPTAPAPYLPVHPGAARLFLSEQVSAEGYVVDTKPEQVIVVGHPTLHRGVMKLLKDPDVRLIVLSRTNQLTDPYRRADATGTRIKTTGELDKNWLKVCSAASDLAAETVRTALEDDTLGFTGLHAAAAVADTLAVGDTLVLGASNPVRDASFLGLPYDGVSTYAPRGAAGIDGTISQTLGVAAATSTLNPEEPRTPRTIALLGDVTFLHDAGGLNIPEHSPQPDNVTIVVANDSGCGIFETLEAGDPDYRDVFEQVFATPCNVDIAALCDAYDWEYIRAETTQQLLDALVDTCEKPRGRTIIEAITTRTTRRELAHKAQL
ncbi:2-succinyl-5-enolpyruvyl-6-hydroxy-3-cyclohexene-1-carboxylic-acid synthase [Corynebacterium argentoratense]|uniref:2-succinyl-5-enolpyruvyl-6-hydroxy-3- cyclohexene-1-carboxylic-acid synthase n=1 Tax=Corynebacterium argentoratense TaxID=42817 RepID=UPI0009E1E850|nr:2-succinyl-5-enolpyruvyl-6-hydroxy-3-cyclohexene-1-carboxylic-acid synthase [Corynebacterium argentoratense]